MQFIVTDENVLSMRKRDIPIIKISLLSSAVIIVIMPATWNNLPTKNKYSALNHRNANPPIIGNEKCSPKNKDARYTELSLLNENLLHNINVKEE